MSMKKIIPVICAMGLFFACSMTVLAGNQPTIKPDKKSVSVSHTDKDGSIVKFEVKDWHVTDAFTVKYEIDDPSIVKVELERQEGDNFRLKVKPKGTGSTVVKVWLDGYSRTARYILADSINYQREEDKGISIRHYGYMTGTKGEAATIDATEIENVDGEERLCVYFTFKDKGLGDGESACFSAKCEEADGDPIETTSATAVGITEGGTGYKIYFKLPKDTEIVKLVNDDL